MRINSERFRRTRRTVLMALAAPLLAAAQPGTAIAASDFPSKPVVFVVPYAPGTVGDLWARMLSPELAKEWGQPVIVENRPGGAALIGMNQVRKAKPDGHTLLLGSLSTSMAGLTKANLDFDPQAELAPVYKYLSFKIVFATNAPTYEQAKDLRELGEYSRTQPNGIFVGDTGPGTAFNMTMGFVLKGLKFKYEPVGFNSMSEIALATIRNDVQLMVNTPSVLKGHFDDKTMFPLAALSEERYADMPEVPTVKELGYDGFVPEVWNGLFAPRGTPPEVLDEIAQTVQKVSMRPDMKDRIESTFTGVIPSGARSEFEQSLKDDTERWKSFLKEINFKPL